MQEKLKLGVIVSPSVWQPPCSGVVQVNYDGEKLGEWGQGMGFVIRDSTGAVWRAIVN